MPSGLTKLVTPSPELAVIVGTEPLPRTAVVAKLWGYIRKHSLQDPADKRVIVADEALKPIIGERATMFELNKMIGK